MQGGGSANGLEAGNMLWLIQRDFLQGKTVGAMVADALAEQPNPHGDKDIVQVLRLLSRHRFRIMVCHVCHLVVLPAKGTGTGAKGNPS